MAFSQRATDPLDSVHLEIGKLDSYGWALNKRAGGISRSNRFYKRDPGLTGRPNRTKLASESARHTAAVDDWDTLMQKGHSNAGV